MSPAVFFSTVCRKIFILFQTGEKESMRDLHGAEAVLPPCGFKKVYKLSLIEAEKKGMITYHIAWDTVLRPAHL